MSGKSAKKNRRVIRKFNKEVFKDFTVEVSAMPFFKRLWFCLMMGLCLHALQKGLKPEIMAKREDNAALRRVNHKEHFGYVFAALWLMFVAMLITYWAV